MRPLSIEAPKVLLPVGNEALVDHAIGRVRTVTRSIAANVHASQPALVEHLRNHPDCGCVSVESGPALGTAGPLAANRDWIGGRPALVVNGDTWCPGALDDLVANWDGATVRILVAGPEPFGPRSRVAGSLLPWSEVVRLEPVPTGLWEGSWKGALADGRIEAVHHLGPTFDCATPADLHAANMAWSGGANVVADDADVAGRIERTVVLAGARVEARERLRDAIRTPHRTVLIRGGTRS